MNASEAAFNPTPTYEFATDQLDVFCFNGRHGFMGVVFEQVQGFGASADPLVSMVFVDGGAYHYDSLDSVPVLVARYADMKKRRSEPVPPPTWKTR
jgi:hypothetical protein